jgi:hypothetical protein
MGGIRVATKVISPSEKLLLDRILIQRLATTPDLGQKFSSLKEMMDELMRDFKRRYPDEEEV